MGGIARIAPLRALLVAGLMVSGCSLMDRSDEAPAPAWETVEKTTIAGVVVEDVTYRSGPLEIRAQVCRPSRDGRHPVMIWNHGGYAGLTDRNSANGPCVRFASRGWVMAESSYRGEDGSDGRIEVCQGEVDDVLAMLDIVREQTYADAKRVAMVGQSHGGCITSRAVARGAPIHVAVDIAGPKDWGALWRDFDRAARSRTTKPAARKVFARLNDTVEQAVGGTPDEYPERYAERSPNTYASTIARWDRPFLVMHGGADAIIPVQQSCDFAAKVGGFRAYRFESAGGVRSAPPKGCEGLSWQEAPTPVGTFSAGRYLLTYDGIDHLLLGAGQRLTADLLSFLEVKLRAGP